MFDRNSTTTDKYKINPRTEVTVKNTRVEQDDGSSYYNAIITVKHKQPRRDHPLVFGTPDEIEKFVNDIDFEDPQMKIPGTDLPVGHDRKDLN